MWRRFIDHVFFIYSDSEKNFKRFLKDLNGFQASIKSNFEKLKMKVNFLDVVTKIKNGRSADETTFNKSKDSYNNALAKSGFEHKITFQKQQNISKVANNTENRKRNIIWFNPPFSLNVSTNTGKKFFSLLGEHFPKTHQLHKLFNRNNVKVSYSSLPTNITILLSMSQKETQQNFLISCGVKRKRRLMWIMIGAF